MFPFLNIIQYSELLGVAEKSIAIRFDIAGQLEQLSNLGKSYGIQVGLT